MLFTHILSRNFNLRTFFSQNLNLRTFLSSGKFLRAKICSLESFWLFCLWCIYIFIYMYINLGYCSDGLYNGREWSSDWWMDIREIWNVLNRHTHIKPKPWKLSKQLKRTKLWSIEALDPISRGNCQPQFAVHLLIYCIVKLDETQYTSIWKSRTTQALVSLYNIALKLKRRDKINKI